MGLELDNLGVGRYVILWTDVCICPDCLYLKLPSLETELRFRIFT